MMCEINGKPASSDFEVLERQANPGITRVCFSPLTGRTHQLRIHSQHYGHPIIGCDLYGSVATQALAARLMLHANSLAFIHPMTGEPFEMVCPPPF
jgi:tRNA pseudouridine32 synthase/23S rRNA pseudouridine746 synthase